MQLLYLVLIAAVLISSSAAVTASLHVLERLPSTPRGWTQGDRPPAAIILSFRLAVRQHRAIEFEQHVVDISTPDHPHYGRHMTRDDIKSFLRPADSVTEAIVDWLQSFDVRDISHDGDWLSFSASIAQAEKMLHTTFHYYHSTTSQVIQIRTLQYSVPADLDIQTIQPTTRFIHFRPQKTFITSSKATSNTSHPSQYDAIFCNTTVTPTCLRGLYGLDGFTAKAADGLRLGISGYLEQYAQYADLEKFMAQYAPYAESCNFTVVSINGGQNTQGNFTASSSTSEANVVSMRSVQ